MAVGIRPESVAPASVAVAGTANPLSEAKVAVQSMIIQADPDNVGYIYVGGPDVDADNGIILGPGEKLGSDSLRRSTSNDSFYLSEWYINADNSGDSVRILILDYRG